MIIALAPLIIAIVGLLMWVLSSNAKVQRFSEILFICGGAQAIFVLVVHLF